MNLWAEFIILAPVVPKLTSFSMEIVYQKFQLLHEKIRSIDFKAIPETTLQFLIQLLERIRIFGFASNMDEYEKRKLGVFNQLNFFQLITGLLIPVLGMMSRVDVPLSAWLIACLPACTSAAVLFLTNLKKVEAALLTYFIAYPFFYLRSVFKWHECRNRIAFYFIRHSFSIFFTGYRLYALYRGFLYGKLFYSFSCIKRFYLRSGTGE